MYARQFDEQVLTFDFARGLVLDNLLIADRETDSLWSQLDGQAISGPMEGTPLEILPSIQTTWSYWRDQHPETGVVSVPGEDGLPYHYFDPDGRSSFPGRRSQEHDASQLGLGIVRDQTACFYPLSELARGASPLRDETSFGETLTIHHEAGHHTAWARDQEGRLLPAILVYESAWWRFFPNSRRHGFHQESAEEASAEPATGEESRPSAPEDQ